MRSHLTALMLLATLASAHGITRYATIHNHFGSIAAPESAHIGGERLIADNPTASPMLLTDTTALAAGRFRVRSLS